MKKEYLAFLMAMVITCSQIGGTGISFVKALMEYEDLEIDSPYNTYKVTALPIGPIANFAESSLNAVVEPADTDYMYFLHDKKGEIYYAETYEEHLQNRDEYMK